MNESAELRLEHEHAADDDSALVARARTGERAAVEVLVSRYADDVFDAALRVVRDPELAQDVAQDAFVNALRGLPRFRGEASFKTWLLRIVVNTGRSAARKRGRRREVALEVLGDPLETSNDPANRALDRIEAGQVERAMQRLPEKQRLSVSLRLHQGLSYREIADVTDSTEGAARVNYHLGIKRLREWLT